ncbi:MAG: CDP-alcohol phosphatidyltransferase family protein [Chitinispirillaceae bacterium]
MRMFSKVGIHPNHLTLLGVALFGAAGYFSAAGEWFWALILLACGSVMDLLDGQLARECDKMTVFGAILDSSCDRITEIFLLLGLLIFYMQNSIMQGWGVYLCFTAIAGSIMVSYVKARCEGAGVSCSRGLLQRPERLILIAFGLLLGYEIMVWILGGVTVLATVTVFERLVIASVQCRRIDQSLPDEVSTESSLDSGICRE